MGIETKSIGFLFDEMITNNIRCWMAQEKIVDTSLSDEERLKAAMDAQTYNVRRSKLIRAIDLFFSQTDTVFEKSYSYEEGLKK